MAFISKRPVKAGDLSGISGKLSGHSRGIGGSDGHSVRTFTPLSLRLQVCQSAVPDITAQPGSISLAVLPAQAQVFQPSQSGVTIQQSVYPGD